MVLGSFSSFHINKKKCFSFSKPYTFKCSMTLTSLDQGKEKYLYIIAEIPRDDELIPF